ncbi:hypothetical protein ACNHYB_15130 [Isoptericola jiangsuensis]|uniref:hypothetical protein n=1 Tax=Isoptericola jiangsuensis TaxID=548579 RepID=UPI003AB080B7
MSAPSVFVRRLAARTARRLGLRRPMPRGRRLVLHLGSQKTGTTAVQAWCRQNAAVLAAAGVTARTDQGEIRKTLGGWYEAARPGSAERLEAYLTQSWHDTRRPGLYYSCESNVGAAFLDSSPALYPRLADNLAALESATAGVPRHVQFSVRSYRDFLESAYQQQLKAGRSRPFEALADRVLDDLSWRPVVSTLIETFGAENVTVYDYDRARPEGSGLVRQIILDAVHRLGGAPVDVTVDESHRVNVRYSQRMADLSMATLPLLRTPQERAALHQFSVQTLGRHPVPDDAPARFLTGDAVEALAARYAADIDWVAERVEVR